MPTDAVPQVLGAGLGCARAAFETSGAAKCPLQAVFTRHAPVPQARNARLVGPAGDDPVRLGMESEFRRCVPSRPCSEASQLMGPMSPVVTVTGERNGDIWLHPASRWVRVWVRTSCN
jgi:hypothetical protein